MSPVFCCALLFFSDYLVILQLPEHLALQCMHKTFFLYFRNTCVKHIFIIMTQHLHPPQNPAWNSSLDGMSSVSLPQVMWKQRLKINLTSSSTYCCPSLGLSADLLPLCSSSGFVSPSSKGASCPPSPFWWHSSSAPPLTGTSSPSSPSSSYCSGSPVPRVKD